LKELAIGGVIALFIGIDVYVRARANRPPDRLERALALAWLIIRRTLCHGMAALMTALAGGMGWAVLDRKAPAGNLLGSLALVVFALICVHWGRFGRGYSTSALDDKPVHERRRRRCGWRHQSRTVAAS